MLDSQQIDNPFPDKSLGVNGPLSTTSPLVAAVSLILLNSWISDTCNLAHLHANWKPIVSGWTVDRG